jgi:hypothetical protein
MLARVAPPANRGLVACGAGQAVVLHAAHLESFHAAPGANLGFDIMPNGQSRECGTGIAGWVQPLVSDFRPVSVMSVSICRVVGPNLVLIIIDIFY